MRFPIPFSINHRAKEGFFSAESMQVGALAAISCLALLSLLVMANPNCAPQPNDGLSPKDKKQVIRLHEIVQHSHGVWQNVPEQDRHYLIEEVSYGNEKSAQMLFATAAKGRSKKPQKRSSPPSIRDRAK